jgi:hypothetical protein
MAALLPHLKVVQLPQETVLFERGDAINAVYFPSLEVLSATRVLTRSPCR